MYNGVYIEEYKPPCARNMLLKSEWWKNLIYRIIVIACYSMHGNIEK
jgi:hypothetical protein